MHTIQITYLLRPEKGAFRVHLVWIACGINNRKIFGVTFTPQITPSLQTYQIRRLSGVLTLSPPMPGFE